MKKKLLKFFIALFVLLLLLFYVFNSRLEVTAEDKKYLQLFLAGWKLDDSVKSAHVDFDSEIRYISTLQDSAIMGISHYYNPYYTLGSVKYYYETRRGYCYDRAALLEKLLRYSGFSTRHVFIYFDNNKEHLGKMDFFRHNSSHAMMEVKTSRGWMIVGTNCNWLGLNQDGTVMSIFAMRESVRSDKLNLKKSGNFGIKFWEVISHKGDFNIVYGLYSRHGEFLTSSPVENWLHKINIRSPFPDYNIRELMYNF